MNKGRVYAICLVEFSLKETSWDSGILVLTDLITKTPNPRDSWGWRKTPRAEGSPPCVAMETRRPSHQAWDGSRFY